MKEEVGGRPAAEVLVRAGVDPRTAASVDLRFSPDVVLVFTTAFVGRDDFPLHYAFVSLAVATAPTARRSPGSVDDLAPTCWSRWALNWHNGGRFFTKAAEAIGGMDAHGIVVACGSWWRRPRPTSWRCRTCRSWRCCPGSARWCATEATTPCARRLAHGLPLVVAPIRDDQPAIAAQVEAAGAGVRHVPPGRPEELRAALASGPRDQGLQAGAESGGRSRPRAARRRPPTSWRACRPSSCARRPHLAEPAVDVVTSRWGWRRGQRVPRAVAPRRSRRSMAAARRWKWAACQ